MRDALSFPVPVSERISVVYVDKCTLERDGHSLVIVEGSYRTIIPVAKTSVIMMGPGTTVTHAAVALAALEGCNLLWTGEGAVRLYSCANPRSNSEALLKQAALALDPSTKLLAARRIYRLMFGEDAPERRSIDQLRGIEGAKVKQIYRSLSQEFSLSWEGRRQIANDPLNLAISTATGALYGITEAAILALGYSPAIGFVHAGDPRSFVFDIADTVKFKTVVPLVFRLIKYSNVDVEHRVRTACRDMFYAEKMLEKIVQIIFEVIHGDGSD